MKNEKKYLDIDCISDEHLILIGSMLVFKLGKIKTIFQVIYSDYNIGFFPFIKSEKDLLKIIELIGEIFISSLISGDNVDYISDKDFFYKKAWKRENKVGFSKGKEYDISISEKSLILLGKISLIYLANRIITFDFPDAEKLIITAHNKFSINKKDLISISSKILKYSSDVLLLLVNVGLLKIIDSIKDK